MSLLRKEFEEEKLRRQKIIDEAAYGWAVKNLIIVNERINRTSINRLTNSIIKFDEKFGPFKDKLPAINDIIHDAESGMELVLTGKTSDNKATEMMQRLSLIYNILSDFFANDLKILVKTPLFKIPRSEPDVRLDSISTQGYNPKLIVSAFETALKPSKEEMKLMSKVYKNIPFPNIDAGLIAKQLLSLSYNDLTSLMSTEKVPMVAVEEPKELKKKPEEINEEALNEQNQNFEEVAALIPFFNKISQFISSNKQFFPKTTEQLRNTLTQLQKVQQGGVGQKVLSFFGRDAATRLKRTYEMFANLKNQLPGMVDLLNANVLLSEQTNPEQTTTSPATTNTPETTEPNQNNQKIDQNINKAINQVRQMLTKAVSISKFKGQPLVDPNVFVEEFMNYITQTGFKDKNPETIKDNVKNIQSFAKNFISSIDTSNQSNILTNTGATAPATGPQQTKGATQAQTGTPTGQGSTAAQGTNAPRRTGSSPASTKTKPIQISRNTPKEQLQALVQKTGVNANELGKLVDNPNIKLTVNPNLFNQ